MSRTSQSCIAQVTGMAVQGSAEWCTALWGAPIGEQQDIVEEGEDLWCRLQQADDCRQPHGVGHDPQPFYHGEGRRGVQACRHRSDVSEPL